MWRVELEDCIRAENGTLKRPVRRVLLVDTIGKDEAQAEIKALYKEGKRAGMIYKLITVSKVDPVSENGKVMQATYTPLF
jgi:hypothetical protein